MSMEDGYLEQAYEDKASQMHSWQVAEQDEGEPAVEPIHDLECVVCGMEDYDENLAEYIDNNGDHVVCHEGCSFPGWRDA